MSEKKSVWNRFDSAFQGVSAFAILNASGEYVCRVCVKYPPKGHGERPVYAYVHFIGFPVLIGKATGYGYDKTSAAIESACSSKMQHIGMYKGESLPEAIEALRVALKDMGGFDLSSVCRKLGFTVLNIL